jgi:hypothetical protein
MDEHGVEGLRGREAGLDRLIDGEGPGRDPALQQGGQVAGRLAGPGNEQRADVRLLRDQELGQPAQIAAGRLSFAEASRPSRPGRGVADGENGPAAVGGQGREGGDAVGAGEGEGGDLAQIGFGLRDGSNDQQGRNDGLEAEGGQAVGGARGAGLGARDPDPADRRQASTR